MYGRTLKEGCRNLITNNFKIVLLKKFNLLCIQQHVEKNVESDLPDLNDTKKAAGYENPKNSIFDYLFMLLCNCLF